MELRDKYINPFTDYGFKKLFGTELNKDLLIDFLNQVLPERHHIQDLSYTPTELFQKLFEAAEIARFDPEEKAKYEESLKYYRDLKNVVDTSFEEGKEEGKIEVILRSHEAGLDVRTIGRSCDLSPCKSPKMLVSGSVT
ncbi:MAG: PD-(D/E)XK nuclease family transposase [Phaeodactylibacter sp.]|nr:PD-(D/E)XK nuclease family transposase [Phaeodactylibacter sp.]